MRNISVIGSTGTIGVNTLDVISRHPEQLKVFALTANTQVEKLYEQCLEFQPQYAVMRDETCAKELRERLVGSDVHVLAGGQGLDDVASANDVDVVMCAIVGAAGLSSTLAAARAGKDVLLANKEALVMSGDIFMQTVRDNEANLIPIDSEHNAIYQCLPETHCSSLVKAQCGLSDLGIDKVLLTGSGGPFRERTHASLADITPAQAIAHPNWTMGPKISVDSATMMNKGLEYIEARWLFSASAEQLEIVVHPESIIHSMVQYADGSVLAQLGQPDMRTPIAYGLGYPERINAGVKSLDFTQLSSLNFEAANPERFPAIALAQEAMASGGTAPAVLNAANEVAVDAFLAERIGFLDITDLIDAVLQQQEVTSAENLDVVMAADADARRLANDWIKEQRA